MTAYTVALPGRFADWFAETMIANGEVDDPDERNLYDRWCDRSMRTRGRGYTATLDRLTIGAVAILAEYADACAGANVDDGIPAELHAARCVYDRCAALLIAAGWVPIGAGIWDNDNGR